MCSQLHTLNSWYVQVVAFTGEAPLVAGTAARAAAQLGSVGLMAALVLFSLSGMLLNYSLFLCTMCNSALTTTIVGVLKVGILECIHVFTRMHLSFSTTQHVHQACRA